MASGRTVGSINEKEGSPVFDREEFGGKVHDLSSVCTKKPAPCLKQLEEDRKIDVDDPVKKEDSTFIRASARESISQLACHQGKIKHEFHLQPSLWCLL